MFNVTKCFKLSSKIILNPGCLVRTISTQQTGGPSGKVFPYKSRKPKVDRAQRIRDIVVPPKPPPRKVTRCRMKWPQSPLVSGATTYDPSFLDPARIILMRGPRVALRKHVHRNEPKRRYKDGDIVNAGELLRKQRAAVQWKAGQFVKVGSDHSLRAQVRGTLKFTTEYDPDKVSFKRPKQFSDILPEEEKLRTVVHVIPEEQHSRFKLIEQI